MPASAMDFHGQSFVGVSRGTYSRGAVAVVEVEFIAIRRDL